MKTISIYKVNTGTNQFFEGGHEFYCRNLNSVLTLIFQELSLAEYEITKTTEKRIRAYIKIRKDKETINFSLNDFIKDKEYYINITNINLV